MKDPLKEKSFAFALRIVKLYKHLQRNEKGFPINRQILRSGTNPGAMVREAKNAESAKDFIHKLSIAQKEIGETIYWLELLRESKYLDDDAFNSINKDAIEIIKILTASIKTRKKNIEKN